MAEREMAAMPGCINACACSPRHAPARARGLTLPATLTGMQAKEIMYHKANLNRIMSEYTGQPIEKVRRRPASACQPAASASVPHPHLPCFRTCWLDVAASAGLSVSWRGASSRRRPHHASKATGCYELRRGYIQPHAPCTG